MIKVNITKFMVISTVMSLTMAAPTPEDAEATILSYENNSDGLGNYEFSFETSNGIQRKESGKLVNVGQSDEHLEVQGVYSYTDANGELIIVRYTADENGYHIEESPEILTQSLSPNVVASLLG